MKLALAATFGLVCMSSAFAQTAMQPTLNLALPPGQNVVDSTASTTTANDPPGKYYGDVGGNGPPDSTTTVSGSVSTMVGYAKGYGTGISNGADLNVNTQLKNGNTVNLNISVMQSNGLPGGWGYGYGRPWSH
jgi:hypothetical protein